MALDRHGITSSNGGTALIVGSLLCGGHVYLDLTGDIERSANR